MMRVVIDTNILVSGDEDLLVLHPFEGIPILIPAVFLGRLRESPE